MDKNIEGLSRDVVADNIAQLKQIFPEVFCEGKVDFEVLKATLGEYLETQEERYQFNWHGKAQARRIAQTQSTGTLRPCKEESKDWDSTQNVFIEGDNLEVLKLLQKSYHKKVKMIYIDPPYNTGKEFIYPDNFKENLDTYLQYTGQIDAEGRKFGTNAETTGRYHTNWLNMMYPRLKLARNLLADDGVIFISIDDNEQANLKKLCDEVFGEENFVAHLLWKRRASSAMADNNVSIDHEYVICYQKGKLKGLIGFKKDFKNYSNPDNDERGAWVMGDLTVGMTASMRPNQAYDLVDKKTGHIYPYNPNRVWAYIPESMDKMIDEERIIFPSDPSKRPMQKRFQKELKSSYNPFSTLMMDKVGLNTEATRTIQEVLGGNIFDYSKPLSLLKNLIPQICNDAEIIIDFFSGSSVTAHAIMDLNAQDNGKRKHIMVQLPEPCDEKSEAHKAGYQTIADIGKERIRRAGEKILADNQDKDGIEDLDVGFKVFKLDSSNIKAWDADFDNLEDDLISAIENTKADRSEDDLLYEILLKYGLDLTIPIETHTFYDKTVYSIGLGRLIVCLDNDITLEVVEAIGKLKEEYQPETCHVVFKDNGFKDDVVKTNAIQVLKQYEIEEVKSL